MVENTCPILRVEDLQKSVDYYVHKLGFHVNWQDDFSAGIARERGGIILILQGQGCSGTYVWVGVQDVFAILEEFRASGASIRHEPKNYPWAMEMKVNDPDGHVLRFGSEPDSAKPWDDWIE